MELCSMKMNPVNQYCKLTALHKDRLIEYLWVRLSQILIDLVKIEGFFLPAGLKQEISSIDCYSLVLLGIADLPKVFSFMNYRCAKIALQRNFIYNWNGWSYLDGYFDMVNEHSVESFTIRFDNIWMHLYRFSKSLNLGFSYILKKIAEFPDSFSFEIENIYPPPLLWICLGSNRMWLMWLMIRYNDFKIPIIREVYRQC